MNRPTSIRTPFSAFLAVVLFLLPLAAHGQAPGSPDLSFGDAGLFRTPVWPNYGQTLEELLLLPDGKMLAVGSLWGNGHGTGNNRFMLIRYNSDGRIDQSFANQGISAPIFGYDGRAFSGAVLPDGRIIVVGRYLNDLTIARYNANGETEQKFRTANGLQRIDLAEPGFVSDDWPAKMVLRSDGSFLVVSLSYSSPSGTDPYYAQPSIVVSSHRPDGELDPAFAAGGKFVKPLSLHGYSIWNVRVEHDGTMFVHASGSERTDFMDPTAPRRSENITLKLRPDGLPDPLFGKNGVLRSSVANDKQVIKTFPDGSMLARNGKALVYLTRNGAVLEEVINGQMITVDGQTFEKLGYLVQNDGTILSFGRLPDSQWRTGLVRFLSTGDLDTSFGTNGLVHPNNDASFGNERWFMLQDDGKILRVGRSSSAPFAIVLGRYHG